MAIIRMKKMLFYGYHGVDESEQKRGGTFEVDLENIFDNIPYYRYF